MPSSPLLQHRRSCSPGSRGLNVSRGWIVAAVVWIRNAPPEAQQAIGVATARLNTRSVVQESAVVSNAIRIKALATVARLGVEAVHRTAGARPTAALATSEGISVAVTVGVQQGATAGTGRGRAFAGRERLRVRAEREMPPELTTLIRLSVSLVLAFGAIAKAKDIGAFASALGGYPIVPSRQALPIAVATVLAELTVALGLFAGSPKDLVFPAGALLFLCFAGGTALTLRANPEAECGCLGRVLRLRMGWLSVALNVAVAALLLAALPESVTRAPLPVDGTPLAASDVAVLWGCAVLVALVYWLATYAQSVWKVIEKGSDTKPIPELQ